MPRLLGRRVDRLAGSVGEFVLGTNQGDEVHCKAVVLAAGAGAFGTESAALAGIERSRRTAACNISCAGARISAAPAS